MKPRILIFATCFLLAVQASARFETKLNDELFLSKIQQNVFVVTHYFPWESNSMVIQASENEVVLIDTPYDSTATALLLNWIQTELKPQKITAINTGYHIDNLGGNACLRAHGIDIYGSDLTCELIEQRGAATQNQIVSWLKPHQENYKKVYETMKFVAPNKVYNISEGLSLNIGKLNLEVFFPGESHAPDNVTVYIKELNILFGGCMVKSTESKNLGFTGDANMQEWPQSIRKIDEKYPGVRIIIPHHGQWGDRTLLDHTLLLFEN